MKKFFALLLLIIALLFGATFLILFAAGKKENGWVATKANVRGSALFYKDTPYTLNYRQQKELIRLLNRSSKTPPPSSFNPYPSVSKIELYLFDDQTITLVPNPTLSLMQMNNHEKTFIKISSPPKMKSLLETIYDH